MQLATQEKETINHTEASNLNQLVIPGVPTQQDALEAKFDSMTTELATDMGELFETKPGEGLYDGYRRAMVVRSFLRAMLWITREANGYGSVRYFAHQNKKRSKLMLKASAEISVEHNIDNMVSGRHKIGKTFLDLDV